MFPLNTAMNQADQVTQVQSEWKNKILPRGNQISNSKRQIFDSKGYKGPVWILRWSQVHSFNLVLRDKPWCPPSSCYSNSWSKTMSQKWQNDCRFHCLPCSCNLPALFCCCCCCFKVNHIMMVVLYILANTEYSCRHTKNPKHSTFSQLSQIERQLFQSSYELA